MTNIRLRVALHQCHRHRNSICFRHLKSLPRPGQYPSPFCPSPSSTYYGCEVEPWSESSSTVSPTPPPISAPPSSPTSIPPSLSLCSSSTLSPARSEGPPGPMTTSTRSVTSPATPCRSLWPSTTPTSMRSPVTTHVMWARCYRCFPGYRGPTTTACRCWPCRRSFTRCRDMAGENQVYRASTTIKRGGITQVSGVRSGLWMGKAEEGGDNLHHEVRSHVYGGEQRRRGWGGDWFGATQA